MCPLPRPATSVKKVSVLFIWEFSRTCHLIDIKMSLNVSEYWIISAPGEKTCQQTWDRLNQATAKHGLSTNWKFHIPDLKVGTLDQLVGLSDDLAKVDAYAEQMARKVAGYLAEVLEDQREKLAENLTACGMDLATYLTRFQWDMAKYPVKQSLRGLSETIGKQVGQIESDLKGKAAAYNQLKQSLHSMEKKQTGSLLTRNLGDLVRPEHFVLDSEYLTTLVVVVPLSFLNDWHAKYETLTEKVVPRSVVRHMWQFRRLVMLNCCFSLSGLLS